MNTGSLCCIVIASLLALAAPHAAAENWPQWRGPFFNGSTTETGLPTVFSRTENVVWSVPMPGPSGATPAVWGEKVFVSSVDAKTGDLLAIALDARTGKVLWRKTTGKDRKIPRNNMASPSPIADGKRVYFYYGTQGLFAFDLAGKPLWSRDLEKDHGHNTLMFGYSSSPLLYKDRLYIVAIRNHRQEAYGQGPPAERESYLLAIDPKTGKDLWLQARPTDARDEAQEAYSTAIPYEAVGRSEVLVYGADYLTGHDAATGAELWRWAGYNPRHINHWRIIPSAVVGDGLVFVCGPKYSRLFAVRPDARGALGEAQVAWTFDKRLSDASTPLVYQDRLYVLDDNRRIVTCFEPKTGAEKWQLQISGDTVMRASLTGADGKLYCIDEAGEAVVLAAGDEPKILHRTKMGGEEMCRSSIVASGGRLFIRTTDTLYCIAKPAGPAAK